MSNLLADIVTAQPALDPEPFFELSPDLLCIAGFDGYFKRINPAVSKLLGYSNEELFSRPINDFVYPDDQDTTAKVRGELKRNRPLYNFENRYLTKSGEIVWLSWTSLPLEKDQLIFAIGRNITHKKKLEEERNALLASLTKANKDLKQITYTTSHDLRSPVNSLLCVFSLLDLTKIEDPETLELIGIIKAAGEHLKLTLDEQVNVLSQKGTLNEPIEEVGLHETLKTVLRSIDSLVKTSRAIIHVDFNSFDRICFNKLYLESVFLNLITNSIKYARPDRSPVIKISSSIQNGVHQLSFTDNGLGFDMEKVRGRIFGFNQKFHNHIDSKGIGLYLVYNHITNLGGQIDVESEVNVGTTFTISFSS